MTYLEHITTYYLSLVGKGTALSSRDLGLVQRWEREGIPAGALCGAIRRAHRRARRQTYFSIADCEKEVQRLTDRVGPSVVAPPDSPDWTPGRLLREIERLGTETEEGPLRRAYRELYRRVKELPGSELPVETVARLDALSVKALERQLPSTARADHRRRARLKARDLLGAQPSKADEERLAASLLEQWYCENYALTLPSTMLIET